MSDEETSPFSDSVMASMTTDAPAKQERPQTEEAPEPQEAPKSAEPQEASEDDEQKTNWKALRESKKEIEKKYKESEATRTDMMAQLEQLKGELTAAKESYDAEEYAKLKAEREEMVNQIAELDILRSPEVRKARERVDSVIESAVKSIKRLMPEAQGFGKILALSPDARDAALRDLLEDASVSSRVASRVWQLVDKVDNAQQQVEEITSMAEGKLEEWKQSKEQQATQQQQSERQKTEQLYHLGLQSAQEDMPELFGIKDGDDEHNKQVAERLGYVKQMLFEPFDETDAVKHAFYASLGRSAVTTQKMQLEALAKSEAERQTLKERLKAYEDAEPGGSGGANEEGGGAGKIEPGWFTNTVLSNMG
jgi:hypothetical protein